MNLCKRSIVLAAYIFLAASFGSTVRATDTQVTVVTLDGKEESASLIELSASEIRFQVSGRAKTLATAELMQLDLGDAKTGPVPPPKVDSKHISAALTDGSLLRAIAIAGQEDQWKLQLDQNDDATKEAANNSITIPKNGLQSLQFRSLPPPAQTAWNDALTTERSDDALGVLRGEELELLQGAIISIDATTIQFRFDGQTIPAPIEKVAGLIWYRRDRVLVRNAATVATKTGSQIMSDNFSWRADDQNPLVKLTGLTGVEFQIPIEQLASIDFASANLKWLSQMELLEVSSQGPPIELSSDDTLLHNRLMQPRFQANSSSGSTTSAAANLIFEIPGQITFRVPEGYHILRGTVQRNRTAKVLLPITLKVDIDGQTVWTGRLAGDQMKLDLDVAVEPNKRCQIAVQSETLLPLGTQTMLLQPRLMR